MVALGQQRAHPERQRRQVVRVLRAARLDQLGDLGGGEHVVLPQRGGEERGQHGLAGAVADDVVVEGPLVLGPLAAGEGLLEELQAVDGEGAALAQQRVPLPASSALALRTCSSVSAGAGAGDLRVPAPRRLAAALQRRGYVHREPLHERPDVVERVVQGQRHAHAGVLHRHRREPGVVRVEAVGEQVPDHVLGDRGQPERDVADRRDVARRQREAELVGEVGEALDALAQPGLQRAAARPRGGASPTRSRRPAAAAGSGRRRSSGRPRSARAGAARGPGTRSRHRPPRRTCSASTPRSRAGGRRARRAPGRGRACRPSRRRASRRRRAAAADGGPAARAARRTGRGRRTCCRRRRPCTRCASAWKRAAEIIASRRSRLLWRISSTVAPFTRSWLAAICTLAWTWWSSSTASVDSTSTGSVARWPSDVVGTTSV